MKKRKSKLLPKPLIGIIGLFLILFFTAVLLKTLAKESDFFRIKEVIVRDEALPSLPATEPLAASEARREAIPIDLSYLKGHNIFAVDLAAQEDYLSQVSPGYRKIRLVKIFPDKIFADFIARRPVACVKLYRYFYLDQDRVLYGAPSETDIANLPVIFGLETKLFGPKQGVRYNIKELITAFNIIKLAGSNKVLKDLQIKKINLADSANTFFTLMPKAASGSEGLEVKIGQDYLADKINILSSLLADERNDWGNIKYIDLRFKDPVIKFKNDTGRFR